MNIFHNKNSCFVILLFQVTLINALHFMHAIMNDVIYVITKAIKVTYGSSITCEPILNCFLKAKLQHHSIFTKRCFSKMGIISRSFLHTLRVHILLRIAKDCIVRFDLISRKCL